MTLIMLLQGSSVLCATDQLRPVIQEVHREIISYRNQHNLKNRKRDPPGETNLVSKKGERTRDLFSMIRVLELPHLNSLE